MQNHIVPVQSTTLVPQSPSMTYILGKLVIFHLYALFECKLSQTSIFHWSFQPDDEYNCFGFGLDYMRYVMVHILCLKHMIFYFNTNTQQEMEECQILNYCPQSTGTGSSLPISLSFSVCFRHRIGIVLCVIQYCNLSTSIICEPLLDLVYGNFLEFLQQLLYRNSLKRGPIAFFVALPAAYLHVRLYPYQGEDENERDITIPSLYSLPQLSTDKTGLYTWMCGGFRDHSVFNEHVNVIAFQMPSSWKTALVQVQRFFQPPPPVLAVLQKLNILTGTL